MKTIRTKLIFWICALFAFIGALIYLPLSNILPRLMTSQILKRDVAIAGFLANEAKEPLLTNNKIGLSLLLNDNLDKLQDADYLFIQGPDGAIISHTFVNGFPRQLLSFGLDTRQAYGVREFLNNGKKMYDIAFPILEQELGVLHLGVSLESGKKDIAQISRINYYVAVVILAGLGAGIAIFLTIGFLFSRQIIRLKNFASKIGQGDLESKIDIRSKDEIGALASVFNEMALRLKEKMQEIKRLNKIEERSRIACDLHDGCAQHAANIIKRIELSEKLLETDPAKTVKELKDLKESTRDNLNWTRQAIFDLKSPQDAEFSLPNRLTDYITDYQRHSGISIKLEVSGAVNGIQPDKAKSIFYIITEALSNVRKHSQAKNTRLRLDANGGSALTINIKDDGEGFNVEDTRLYSLTKGRWGLVTMRERAEGLGGAFSIKSTPGLGTEVFITIPLAQGRQ